MNFSGESIMIDIEKISDDPVFLLLNSANEYSTLESSLLREKYICTGAKSFVLLSDIKETYVPSGEVNT